MDIPGGMYLHEFIMLICGSLLFITLIILLIVYAVQKRSLKALLPFFSLPIVMIGFPSYQKMNYDNGVISIEKLTSAVKENPNNKTARKELEAQIEDVSGRVENDPRSMLEISKAHAALGDTLQALSVAETAAAINPSLREAIPLIELYRAPLDRIEVKAATGTRTGTTLDRSEVESELRQLEDVKTQTPSVYLTRAKLLAAAGDTITAVKLVDSALSMNRKSAEAATLKRRLARIK